MERPCANRRASRRPVGQAGSSGRRGPDYFRVFGMALHNEAQSATWTRSTTAQRALSFPRSSPARKRKIKGTSDVCRQSHLSGDRRRNLGDCVHDQTRAASLSKAPAAPLFLGGGLIHAALHSNVCRKPTFQSHNHSRCGRVVSRDEVMLLLKRRDLVLEPDQILGQRGDVGRLSLWPRDDVPAILESAQRAVPL
jgi:hypothetical protein